MKIGILGGTFDPIHRGHLTLAYAAKKQYGLDKVLFVPALIPPHKAARRDLTPAPYRYRMVEIALRAHPDFEVSDLEFSRAEVSYTVDTLRELKKKYQAGKFFLIVGADSLAEIPQWKEADNIPKFAGILAAPRRPFKADPSAPATLWISMPECPLSSSGIRRWIAQGELKDKQCLPEGVENYIRRMNLYQER